MTVVTVIHIVRKVALCFATLAVIRRVSGQVTTWLNLRTKARVFERRRKS